MGPGFAQNPLVPNEVTWHYSASATRTVTTNGVAQTETVPLPEGELAFFVDGKLECEIHAVGAIAGSACTVDLQQLGPHEVETIFSTTTVSSTATRVDYVGKYPTSTNLQVSIEPTAPEYLYIGDNAYGFEQYGYEVGRLRITGSVSPGSYPTFDCEGQPVGCLIPDVSLKNHNGSVTVPLYAQRRRNPATEREEWHVAFEADQPALREEGYFWQFPNEAIGSQFFHAVGEPNPALYEPSTVTVPLNLNGGHYPFFREFATGEAGGSVEAVEGTLTKVLTLGPYEKVTGLEGSLHLSGEFYGATGEIEGCGYYVTVDGKTDNERRNASNGRVEIDGGFTEKSAVPAGPHTLELWVERKTGAGPGKCALTRGWFEAYERMK
ncbi:MAG TPA: hypothetical protein VH268_07000 [Solirubrobacterales bacterium]|nr:hypothetical protein [Solirubrobacterales bacterium]